MRASGLDVMTMFLPLALPSYKHDAQAHVPTREVHVPFFPGRATCT